MTTITANSTIGIYLSPASYSNPVVIDPGITISASGQALSADADFWTIENQGEISAQNGYGIRLAGGGDVTNAASASIAGGFTGIVFYGASGAMYNAGTIVGTTNTGVYFKYGGTLTNQAGGAISAASYGVLGNHSAVTVDNSGYIAGSLAGVRALGGETITNQAGGTISGATGIVVLNQAGAITNLSAGFIGGSSGAGITFANAAGTVVNAGSISGTVDALMLASGYSNLLVVDPGAQFIGIVDGGNNASSTTASTLELASGASAGTLTNVGSQYVDFGRITVDAGATWTLASGSLSSAYSVIDNGTMTNAATLDGGVTLGAGAVFTNAAAGVIRGNIDFAGGGAYLHVVTPASVTGSVTDFAVGDTIDLEGIDPASVTFSGGSLSFTGGSFALTLAAGGAVSVGASGDGAAISVLCFCADTMIATPRGEVAVQDLAVGDTVSTHRGMTRRIKWIGAGRVLATPGKRGPATPVIVRKDALANDVPNRDLHVTKGHSLFLNDVLIPVEFLVNHRSIVWDDRAQEVAVWHIELDTHDVLIANGAPAESYRDDGNRWLFQNASADWHLPSKPPFAPILTSGPIVDTMWRDLLDRCGTYDTAALTDEPDLHLLVDGRRVDAIERRGDAYIFRLVARPRDVRICSRAATPDELGIARDPRLLGVAITRVVLAQPKRQWTIDAESESLSTGFHAFEAVGRVRWTAGDARVPRSLFAGMGGPALLTLHLGATTRYPNDERRRIAA